jgi:hypothetical protein
MLRFLRKERGPGHRGRGGGIGPGYEGCYEDGLRGLLGRGLHGRGLHGRGLHRGPCWRDLVGRGEVGVARTRIPGRRAGPESSGHFDGGLSCVVGDRSSKLVEES